jgi:hypothetical protein
MVARTKSYTLLLTKSELETIQHLLEEAATTATPEQVPQLETIVGKLYRLLFAEMTGQPHAKWRSTGTHDR